jgi:hypothetical protein
MKTLFCMVISTFLLGGIAVFGNSGAEKSMLENSGDGNV